MFETNVNGRIAMEDSSVQKVKYGVVALIWLGVFVIAGMMVISGALQFELAGLMGGAAFIAAFLGTGVLLQWGQVPEAPAVQQTTTDDSKRKNDQRGVDPLSLLTDDDIAELREDIKHNLRRRMLEGQDGELGSLDALLADSDQRARRK
jgi:hypothetical protein